ncbi:MAG: Integral membrane protein, partial [bacterium]
VVLGAALAYMGMGEVFRLILETVDVDARPGGHSIGRAWHRPAIVLVLLVLVAGTWIYLKRPHVEPPPAAVTAVNGHAELNDRRLNEVVFAAAHNCMSNASIPDWMFPHQQAGIPQQLEDGIRALLIDVHYGFPGGERIKTDLEGEKNTREKLVGALGEEAVVTAERIRNRLVGVDEGKRGLYLCHGFCELGGTEFGRTLEDIRTFLETHPEEVLMMVIEDYVTPQELAAAFTAGDMDQYIYKGPSGPPWPVMKDLVLSGERVVIFLETGTPGIDYLRPAFNHIQETPYTFHTPEDFSSKPNRGGTGGSLFQINHWIETTPTPLPSNAEIVNSMDVLMTRALRCRKERGMLPNIIAVDFYKSGELFAVVDSLNGV